MMARMVLEMGDGEGRRIAHAWGLVVVVAKGRAGSRGFLSGVRPSLRRIWRRGQEGSALFSQMATFFTCWRKETTNGDRPERSNTSPRRRRRRRRRRKEGGKRDG